MMERILRIKEQKGILMDGSVHADGAYICIDMLAKPRSLHPGVLNDLVPIKLLI
jgi:hypothetical protein